MTDASDRLETVEMQVADALIGLYSVAPTVAALCKMLADFGGLPDAEIDVLVAAQERLLRLIEEIEHRLEALPIEYVREWAAVLDSQ